MSFWLVISVKTNLGVHFSSQFNYNCSPTPGSPRPGPALIVLFVHRLSPGCRTAPLRAALRAPALGVGGGGGAYLAGVGVGGGREGRAGSVAVSRDGVCFIYSLVCLSLYLFLSEEPSPRVRPRARGCPVTFRRDKAEPSAGAGSGFGRRQRTAHLREEKALRPRNGGASAVRCHPSGASAASPSPPLSPLSPQKKPPQGFLNSRKAHGPSASAAFSELRWRLVPTPCEMR